MLGPALAYIKSIVFDTLVLFECGVAPVPHVDFMQGA